MTMSEKTNYEKAKELADKIDEEIIAVLQSGKSFKVEAGAGSGKTYSLHGVVEWIDKHKAKEYKRNGKHVACLTYTNAAVEVIASRIFSDSGKVGSSSKSLEARNAGGKPQVWFCVAFKMVCSALCTVLSNFGSLGKVRAETVFCTSFTKAGKPNFCDAEIGTTGTPRQAVSLVTSMVIPAAFAASMRFSAKTVGICSSKSCKERYRLRSRFVASAMLRIQSGFS